MSAARNDNPAAKLEASLLRRMHRQWPFFGSLPSNLETVLVKTDLGIVARHVEPVENKPCRSRPFAQGSWV